MIALRLHGCDKVERMVAWIGVEQVERSFVVFHLVEPFLIAFDEAADGLTERRTIEVFFYAEFLVGIEICRLDIVEVVSESIGHEQQLGHGLDDIFFGVAIEIIDSKCCVCLLDAELHVEGLRGRVVRRVGTWSKLLTGEINDSCCSKEFNYMGIVFLLRLTIMVVVVVVLLISEIVKSVYVVVTDDIALVVGECRLCL